MKATREEMIAEAKQRMLLLDISKGIIKDFIEDGVVSLSEGIGYLYWIDEEEKPMVEELEKKTGGVVYHMIKTYTEIGLMYAILYVSPDKSEWEDDKGNLSQGYAFSYVVNKDEPAFSEFGSIGFRRNIGGLIRNA
jgi:hypothetical protein